MADATEEPPGQRIEPGSPTLENAAFVVLGALSTLAVIVHVAMLLGTV